MHALWLPGILICAMFECMGFGYLLMLDSKLIRLNVYINTFEAYSCTLLITQLHAFSNSICINIKIKLFCLLILIQFIFLILHCSAAKVFSNE